MTTIILSLHPEWWTKMLSGEKMLEIRKTAPHPVYFPLRVVVYLTAPVCAVVGEFICPNAELTDDYERIEKGSCLQPKELREYGKGRKLRAWEVFRPTVYDEPKKIEDFGFKRPPQSWCYGKGSAA